jgi:hypothetical protein
VGIMQSAKSVFSIPRFYNSLDTYLSDKSMNALQPVKLTSFQFWTIWLTVFGLYALSYYMNETGHLEVESRFAEEGISSQAVVRYIKLREASMIYEFRVGKTTFESQGDLEDVSVGDKINIVYLDSNPRINRQGDKPTIAVINDEKNFTLPVALISGIVVSSVVTYMLRIFINVTTQMKNDSTIRGIALRIFLLVSGLIIVNTEAELNQTKDFKPLVSAYAYSKDFAEVYCDHFNGKFSVRFENGSSMGIRFRLCSNPVGLYISVPTNSSKSDPILVPWNDISTDTDKRLSSMGEWIALRFRKVPNMQISLPKEVWEELSSHRKS